VLIPIGSNISFPYQVLYVETWSIHKPRVKEALENKVEESKIMIEVGDVIESGKD